METLKLIPAYCFIAIGLWSLFHFFKKKKFPDLFGESDLKAKLYQPYKDGQYLFYHDGFLSRPYIIPNDEIRDQIEKQRQESTTIFLLGFMLLTVVTILFFEHMKEYMLYLIVGCVFIIYLVGKIINKRFIYPQLNSLDRLEKKTSLVERLRHASSIYTAKQIMFQLIFMSVIMILPVINIYEGEDRYFWLLVLACVVPSIIMFITLLYFKLFDHESDGFA